jgi:hypothetical protein
VGANRPRPRAPDEAKACPDDEGEPLHLRNVRENRYPRWRLEWLNRVWTTQDIAGLLEPYFEHASRLFNVANHLRLQGDSLRCTSRSFGGVPY